MQRVRTGSAGTRREAGVLGGTRVDGEVRAADVADETREIGLLVRVRAGLTDQCSSRSYR